MQRTRSSRAGGDEEDPGSDDYDRKRKGGAGRKAVGLCCVVLACWVLCVVAAGLDAAARPPPPKPPVSPAEAAAAVEHLRKRAYGPSGGLDHDAWRRGSGISAHVVPQPVEPPKPPPQKVFRRKKKTKRSLRTTWTTSLKMQTQIGQTEAATSEMAIQTCNQSNLERRTHRPKSTGLK